MSTIRAASSSGHILTAATACQPRPRRTAGPFARRLSLSRRLAPARLFDHQIRTLNKLAG